MEETARISGAAGTDDAAGRACGEKNTGAKPYLQIQAEGLLAPAAARKLLTALLAAKPADAPPRWPQKPSDLPEPLRNRIVPSRARKLLRADAYLKSLSK